MSELGCDYAWAKPDPAQIKAAGYTFVLRYVSPDPSKNLTVAERDALWAHGISIGLVWESSAGRALDGMTAGMVDARAAVAQANALGMDADVPLFFACDRDTTAGQVRPYYRGVATIRHCCGAYGGIRVVDPLLADGTVRFSWQTCAWSNDPITGRPQVSSTAHLYQRNTPTTSLRGTFDEDVVLHPIPMWTPPGQPQPLLTQETDVRVIRNTDNGRCYLAGPGTVQWLETGPQLDAWLAICGQLDAAPVTTVALADFTHTNQKEPT